MPINYENTKGLKRPNVQREWTPEEQIEFMKCAQSVEYFCENYYFIVHPIKGRMIISLYDFQKEMLRNFQHNRFNIVLSARQAGKALSLDTPILTPNGYESVGDIEVGDTIYGRDGKETKVTYITDIMKDREVYEIEFDNGEKIKADAEHLWTVSTSDWERKGRTGEKTVTTLELIKIQNGLQKRSKPSSVFIKINKVIDFKETKVPIHPYVLGVWLGDGASLDSRISCHIDDYPHYKKEFEKAGYEVGEFKPDKRRNTTGTFTPKGLHKQLRLAGLQNNKNIPKEYLLNSVENRLLLVKGLMDTDGYCEKKASCHFYQSNESLIDQVREVLHSLGIKTHKTRKKTTHKDCLITTFVTDDYDVFSLPRKLKRQRSKDNKHPKNKRIYIRNIKKVESVPVRCLQVDNEDSLFLAGRCLVPTHNTTVSAIYLLWFALFNPDKRIAILANKQSTAAKIVADIKTAYLEIPDFLKPGIVKWDTLSIGFDTSTVIFASATSEDAIRGHAISLLFLDEFAFVPENTADAFWASNFPTLSCLPKNTLILTDSGYSKIGDFIPEGSNKGDYIPVTNMNVWGKKGLESVSHFYVSPKSETKILRTKYGLKHESTLDHPVYCLDSNNLGMKPTQHIQIGDYVRVDFGMDVYGPEVTLNYEDTGKYNNNHSYSLVYDKLDNELAYMIGGYIAEGWSNQNQIYISNMDNEFRNVFLENKNVWFTPVKNDPCKIRSDQKTYRLFSYLMGDVIGKRCYEKEVPSLIMKSPKYIQERFLAGFIDGDGSVNSNGDTILSSTSEELLLQIQIMLLNMGIISNLHTTPADKSLIDKYTLPQGTTLQSVRDSYKLVISRCFSKEIASFGLKLSRKLNRLENTRVSLRDSFKQFKIPLNNLILGEIKKCFNKSGLTQKYVRNNGLRLDKVLKGKTKTINYNWLVKFRDMCDVTDSYILTDIISNKCFYDEVVSISFNICDTYDLTCPTTHSFLQNGVLGSNTGGSCIMVSTPNGSGGLYYDIWRKANLPEGHESKSPFNPIRVGWWQVPGRDEQWKKETIAAIGKVKFAQEHQCSFTGSSHTLIDGDTLERLIGKDPILLPEDGYYIWKRPEQNRLYLFGVDVAKGSNNDYHVINIFDVTHYGTTGRVEQVAMYRKNDIDLFSFVEKIKIIASQWGTPPIIVENNHLGSVVCTELFESEYENLFYDYDKGEYGVNANIKTKPLACSYFKQDIEEGRMVINSEILISELGFFEEVRRGVFEARKGNAFNDDTVSASYWVSYCLRSRFFEDFIHYYKDKNPNVLKELTNINSDELGDEEIAESFFGGFGGEEFNDFQNSLSKI